MWFLCAGTFALAACGHEVHSVPPAATLVIAEKQEPNSLNPLFFTGPTAAVIGPLVYSGLLTMDDRGHLQPDLAVAVPTRENGGISHDGLTITYRLRPDARWQDGVPLTAADVTYTYAAIMNPLNNVPSRFGYDAIRTIEAVDTRTLRVRLHRPYAPILSLFMAPDQNFKVLPRHLLARYRDLNTVPFNEAPIGSGPFRVVKWQHGERLRLVRNDTYFRGKPRITAIDLRFVPDSATILNQLRTREVGAAFFADPTFLSQYEMLPGYRVERVWESGFGNLLFNTQKPVVADARVRFAIARAIDVPRVVRNSTKGAQDSVDAGRGLFGWGYDPNIVAPRYDPVGAARELDRTGWRRGSGGMRRNNGRPLSLDFAFPSGNAATSAMAVDLQQELRDAGIAITLRPYAPSLFRAPAAAGGPLFAGKFDLAFLDVFGTSDPDTHWYLGCTEVPPHGFNVQRFCDPIIDAAQAAGARTYDRETRRRQSMLVQKRVAQAVPFVTLYQTKSVNVIPALLHGLRSSPLSPFWNVAEWSFAAK